MEANPSFELDSDFKFITPAEELPKKPESHANRLKPKERVFFARLGAAALAAIMLTSSTKAVKSYVPKLLAIEKESPDAASGEIPGTIYDQDGNILFTPDREADPNLKPVVNLNPTVEYIKTSPAMKVVEKTKDSKPAIVSVISSVVKSIAEEIIASELASTKENIGDSVKEATDSGSEPDLISESPSSTWDGPILNAVNGHIDGPSGDETYYDLPMNHIVDRMHRMGVEGEYWVREDGVKMLGDYVMVAANLDKHPRGSIVETSLGTGIVCDTGGFAEEHPNRLDIATDWTTSK